MHINFTSSGGFANLQLAYRGDTSELPQDVAEKLSELVESSAFFDIRQSDLAPTSAGPPDVFSYHVSLSEGNRHNSLSVNDVTAPASLRPLLSFLQKLALDQKRTGQS